MRIDRTTAWWFLILLFDNFFLFGWSSSSSSFSSYALAFSATTPTKASTTRTSSTSTSTMKQTTTAAEQEGKAAAAVAAAEVLGSKGFHHIEFYCGDARSTSLVFQQALGLTCAGESHQGTGNDQCVSYGLVSHNVRLVITAPYSRRVVVSQRQPPRSDKNNNAEEDDAVTTTTNEMLAAAVQPAGTYPLPGFALDTAHEWIAQHGTFVHAIGIVVDDVTVAYRNALANGGIGLLPPTKLANTDCVMAELQLYGHVVLRLLSDTVASCDTVLPHLVAPARLPPPVADAARTTSETAAAPSNTFGLERMDHIVGNVPILHHTRRYIEQMTGYHEFAEFTSQDVGTMESGLNSVVLANDAATILLPLNEPVTGTVRKSQIQTYLEQNEGPGVQHVALKTRDIITTIRRMKASPIQFDLMNRPNAEYYKDLPNRLGEKLTPEQYIALEELGILADADEEGVLLQIFTKPIGDRPTFFFEIIQRIGCPVEKHTAAETTAAASSGHWWAQLDERPGCGGFGRGNFRALFKSIEEHEKTLKV
jgi:4-hydroxyphenylpyruvate dioxygenase